MSYTDCKALWTFPAVDKLKPSIPVSLTLAVPNGTTFTGHLALSFEAKGSVSVESGCDPKPVAWYGTPPKLIFSVYTPITYDSRTGRIDIDATYPPTSGGNGLTATDKGTLYGGPLIYRRDPSKQDPVNVTGRTTTVVVGQRISLSSRYADGSDLGAPKWSGIKSPDVISDYTFEVGFGHVTPFPAAQLDEARLSFSFVQPGRYTITVTGTNPRSKLKDRAEAIFDVVTPIVAIFSAKQCPVHLAVERGTVHVAMGGPGKPGCHKSGITWRIQVTAPRESGIRFGMTQVLMGAATRDGQSCQFAGGVPQGSVGSDNSVPYAPPERVSAGETKTVTDLDDSPGLKFSAAMPIGSRQTETLHFRDYLMTEPTEDDSIYVALAEMRWTFHFVAVRSKDGWTLTDSTPDGGTRLRVTSEPVSNDAPWARDGEPEWTGTFLNGPLKCPN
jgi:hypothetical protein